MLTIQVPDDATVGDSYARFRFSREGGLSYIGSSRSGEVEDYAITITEDQPGVVITPTDLSNDVVEGGITDTYKVVLTAEPTQTVWVTITGDDDVTTTVSELKFTRDNWDIAQTVTVVAIDDDIAETAANNIGTLTHTTRSLDLAYNEMDIDPVFVNVTDNDLAKVQILRTGGSTRVKEDGTLTDTYEVVLTSKPVGDVEVTIDPGSQLLVADSAAGLATLMANQTPTDLPQSPITLTFTPDDWNTKQIVYLGAFDDAIAEESTRP